MLDLTSLEVVCAAIAFVLIWAWYTIERMTYVTDYLLLTHDRAGSINMLNVMLLQAVASGLLIAAIISSGWFLLSLVWVLVMQLMLVHQWSKAPAETKGQAGRTL